MENLEYLLQQCPLFKKFDTNQIRMILDKYPHQVKSFPKNNFIILQNETCNNLMILIEGEVQAQMVNPEGKLIVMEEFGKNQILAPAFLFSEINKMPVSVFTLKHSEVLYFSRSVLLDMMQGDKNILLNFLNMISNRSHFLTQKMKYHVFMSLKKKIALYLLEEKEKQSSLQVRLQHTQQELADKFGSARPSLARTLKELVNEGIIEIKSKNVCIKNLEELKKASE